MGKKKLRSGETSKGIHGTTKSRSKNDPDYATRRILNQQKAWMLGKNVVLTIDNPNKKMDLGLMTYIIGVAKEKGILTISTKDCKGLLSIFLVKG